MRCFLMKLSKITVSNKSPLISLLKPRSLSLQRRVYLGAFVGARQQVIVENYVIFCVFNEWEARARNRSTAISWSGFCTRAPRKNQRNLTRLDLRFDEVRRRSEKTEDGKATERLDASWKSRETISCPLGC